MITWYALFVVKEGTKVEYFYQPKVATYSLFMFWVDVSSQISTIQLDEDVMFQS